MRTVVATIAFLLFSGAAMGQNFSVKGDVLDEKAEPLSSVAVVLLNPVDSTLQYFAVTGKTGQFEINNIRNGSYLIQVSLLGFNTIYRKISLPSAEGGNLGSLIMTPKVYSMNEVKVTGDRIPMKFLNDTIEYNAKAFKVKPDGVAEDLIRKLPGIEVDRAGNIKAMGENVKNVLVDGKEFFGNDPKVATRNLPADAIDKVQLFDKQSDESRFTGIDDGERNPTLNLMLDENKKSGIFGDVTGGYGSENHGLANAKVYRFTKKSQFAMLGMYNNINQFGFSVGDFINFSGGISALSGGGGHVVLGGESSFPVNFGQPVYGTGSNGAVGLNYSRFKSQDDRVFISYMGNGSSINLEEESSTKNFIPDSYYRVEESKRQQKRDSAHRVNFGIRKRFGDYQNLIVNGGISYNTSANPLSSSSSSYMNEAGVNNLDRTTSDMASRFAGNADASYQLKSRSGKSIVKFSGRGSYSGTESESRYMNRVEYLNPYQLDVTNQFYNLNSEIISASGTFSLTRRVSKSSFAELSLGGGMNNENLKRRQGLAGNELTPDPALSPDFSKSERYIKPSLIWRLSTAKTKLLLGIASNTGNFSTILNDDNGNKKSYGYLLPRASWEYEYRSGRRLMADYSTSVTLPSASQLLPVVNNLNALSLSYGNRELKPEYNNDARLTWWLFDQFSFTTLLTSINARYTTDKINFARTVDSNLGQTARLINVKDNFNAGANIDFSTPFKPFGIMVSFSFNEDYNRGTTIVNDISNDNRNFTHNLSFTISNRKKDKWDIETGTALKVTQSKYSVQSNLDNVYSDISWFGETRYTPGKKLSFMVSADITSYSAKTFDQSKLIPILGAEMNYYFLRNQRGTLTLSGVDLLNRNTGLERRSELNYLIEKKSNMIGRYVMLSFKYRLNKFGDNSSGIDVKIR
ncbi:MAG: outer membrane beta-barrel protein [Bacteroidales bacterium]